MKKLTLLLIFCGLFVFDPSIRAEVVHPQRVYPGAAGPKKKHWWQRKETPQSRAKKRAKQRKKQHQANAAKSAYDPKRNSALPR